MLENASFEMSWFKMQGFRAPPYAIPPPPPMFPTRGWIGDFLSGGG